MGMKVVSIKVEDELLELIDKYAIMHKLPRSVAIRNILERVLKEELKNETIPTARVIKLAKIR